MICLLDIVFSFFLIHLRGKKNIRKYARMLFGKRRASLLKYVSFFFFVFSFFIVVFFFFFFLLFICVRVSVHRQLEKIPTSLLRVCAFSFQLHKNEQISFSVLIQFRNHSCYCRDLVRFSSFSIDSTHTHILFIFQEEKKSNLFSFF